MEDPTKSAIANQLVNLEDEKIKEIIFSYNFQIKSADNVAALCGAYSREELKTTVTYITSQYQTSHPVIIQKMKGGKNKPELATDIKIFLNGILPFTCNTCKNEYCHTTEENAKDNKLLCLMCNRFSHKTCIDESAIKPGTFHLCSLCVGDVEKRKNSPTKDTSESGDGLLNSSSISRLSSINSVSSEEEDEEEKSNKEKEESKDDSEDLESAERESSAKICALYVEGKCPHGLRGRNCVFEHPKKCRYYCSHGTEYPNGCRRGKKCWFFHPRLCENSVKMKVCLNKNCTLIHMMGTRRREPKWNTDERASNFHDARRYRQDSNEHTSNFRDERRYRHDTNEHSSNYHDERLYRHDPKEPKYPVKRPDPWSQENEREVHSENKSSDSNNSFLLKYMDRLKSELKTEQVQQNQQIQTQLAQQIQLGIQQAFSTLQHQQVASIAPVAQNVPANVGQIYFQKPPHS